MSVPALHPTPSSQMRTVLHLLNRSDAISETVPQHVWCWPVHWQKQSILKSIFVNPTRKLEETDRFSGRSYDERYITDFILRYQLPCNPTTAFLTPALRNITHPLTLDVMLEGRPREIYRWTGHDGQQLLLKWHSLAPAGNQHSGGYAEAFDPVAAVQFLDSDPGFLSRYRARGASEPVPFVARFLAWIS